MKERNCTPDKPKNHIPDWVLRQFETDECRIAELEAEVEALNQNILAYMGACGYSVPSTYDGRRTDGVIPVCGLCDAKDKENARLREAECFKCGKSLPPDGDCYACERDELEKENAELRRQLDGVGLDRMEAAHHRDEIATLKGELAACEQCHEKLEAEIEDLLIQLAMVGVYDDHRSVPGDDISAELAVECASLKAEVERLGDQLMAASKEAGKWRTEADLLTKRCEEARKIVEWNNDAAAYFVAKKKWEEGKP